MSAHLEKVFSLTGSGAAGLYVAPELLNNNHVSIASPSLIKIAPEIKVDILNRGHEAIQSNPLPRMSEFLFPEIQISEYIGPIMNKSKEDLKEWVTLHGNEKKIWEMLLIDSINKYGVEPETNSFDVTVKIASVVMAFYTNTIKENGEDPDGNKEYSQDKINKSLLYKIKEKDVFKKPFPLLVFFTNRIFLNQINNRLSGSLNHFDWEMYFRNRPLNKPDFKLGGSNDWRHEINCFITRLEKICYKQDHTDLKLKVIPYYLKLKGRLKWLDEKYKNSGFPYFQKDKVILIQEVLRRREYKHTLFLVKEYKFLATLISSQEKRRQLDTIMSNLNTKFL